MTAKKLLKKIVKNGVQYDLPSADEFVDKSSNQTIWWTKTFTTSPVVPSKTTAATNSWTAIATEKQVYDVAQDLATLDWNVVKKSGDQTIAWTKTFSTEPVIPSKDSAVWTSKTSPATEYQVKAVKDLIPTTTITKSDFDTWTSTTAWLTTAKDVADYVKEKVSSVYVYKGTVSTYNDLPSSNLTIWDTYNVETAHTTAPVFPAWANLAWNGTAWDVLWGIVDLSWYVDKSSNETIWGVKTFSSEPVLPTKTTGATNDWTKPATEAQVYLKLDSDDLGNWTVSVKYALESTAVWSFTTNQSSNWTITVPWEEFMDQDSFDDLPSSKSSDNNSYWIYEEVGA